MHPRNEYFTEEDFENDDFEKNDLIRYELFRERVLGWLMDLRGDPQVDQAIQTIQTLQPGEVLSSTTAGYSDLYDKVKIIQAASCGITQDYYETLSSQKKLLAQAIFNEYEESVLLGEKTWEAKDLYEYDGRLDYRHIRAFQKATNEFLAAWDAGQINPSPQSSLFLEEDQSDNMLARKFKDVDMERRAWVTADQAHPTGLGSVGMGPCLYFHVSGYHQTGSFVMGGGHFPELGHKEVLGMLNEAIYQYGVVGDSLQAVLVGGILAGMPEYLDVIKSSQQYKIVDVRLCNVNTFGESYTVVMDSAHPDKIYFSVDYSGLETPELDDTSEVSDQALPMLVSGEQGSHLRSGNLSFFPPADEDDSVNFEMNEADPSYGHFRP